MAECELCHEEHARIEAAVGGVATKLDHHVGDVHAGLLATVARGDGQLADDVARITDSLLGPVKQYGLHAGDRDTSKGIESKLADVESKVTSLWAQTQNGGVRAHLRSSDTAKLWMAVAAGVATLVVDLLRP